MSHHLPHPIRVSHEPMINAVRSEIRESQIANAIEAGGRMKTWKEQKAIADWSEKAENAALPEEEREWHKFRMRHISELADALLRQDDQFEMTLADAPRLYNAAALIDKFPDQSVSDFKLGDVVLPPDLAVDGRLFIEFGLKSESLAIDVTQDLYFEGAYVTLTENDAETTEVTVHLVTNDPEFSDWENRSYWKTLERMANAVRITVADNMTVYEGFQGVTSNSRFQCDPILVSNMKACFNAYDIAIKTVLYLNEYGHDFDVDFHSRDHDELVRDLANGKDEALWALMQEDVYPIFCLGRRVEPLPPFEEPDLEAVTERQMERSRQEYERAQKSSPGKW